MQAFRQYAYGAPSVRIQEGKLGLTEHAEFGVAPNLTERLQLHKVSRTIQA